MQVRTQLAKPLVPWAKLRPLTIVGGMVVSLVMGASTTASAENLYGDEVVLQGLDKITARVSTFNVKVGQVYRYGSMDIQLFACERTPPEEPPESVAFLKIKDVIDPENPIEYFSGWMYASSPALHGLEHPVHDVWVKECIPSAKPKPNVVVVESPDSTAKPEKKEKSFLEKIFLPKDENDEDAVDKERSDSQLKNLQDGVNTGTPPSASTLIQTPENTLGNKKENQSEDSTTTQ